MPPTLSIDAQTDFSAGAFQGVARHLIPRNGLYEAINSLLDDSGSIYKRGGSAYLSTAEAATNGLPLFLFDGYLSAGRRTFWADASAFGVLDGTEAPLNLAGGGITGPRRGVVIGGVLIVDGKLYAGSLKTANYSTGTISVTQGSAVITGSGTTWNTLVDVGMLLQVGGSGPLLRGEVDRLHDPDHADRGVRGLDRRRATRTSCHRWARSRPRSSRATTPWPATSS
jgi:hypothetical protein